MVGLTGLPLGGILGDWDGVELRPDVVELALMPASGKWTIQNANTAQNTTTEVTAKRMVRWVLTALLTVHMSIVYSRIGVTE